MPQADQIQNLQGKVRSMLVALVFKVCNLLGILAKKTCMTVAKTFRGRGGCYTQAKEDSKNRTRGLDFWPWTLAASVGHGAIRIFNRT